MPELTLTCIHPSTQHRVPTRPSPSQLREVESVTLGAGEMAMQVLSLLQGKGASPNTQQGWGRKGP